MYITLNNSYSTINSNYTTYEYSCKIKNIKSEYITFILTPNKYIDSVSIVVTKIYLNKISYSYLIFILVFFTIFIISIFIIAFYIICKDSNECSKNNSEIQPSLQPNYAPLNPQN